MKTFTARISRSLVTVLALTFIQVIAGPILTPTQTSPVAQAATFDSAGLILNWDMENLATYSGSGTTLGDSSFNSSTGTMMAGGSSGYPSWTSSAPKYLTFSGTSANFNYVKSVDLKPKLDGYATTAPSMQNISVFTWVYPTANGIIVDEVNADNGWQDSWIEMADGKFSFRIWSTSELISDTTTPLNYWYYVGLTYDYQTQALKAYVNGKKVGELTGIDRSAPWETNSGYTSQFAVGRYDPTHLGSASGGNFRFGALHIFNKALSQSVITSNYESSLYRFGPTVGNPSNISQLVNRSDTFSATACTGIKSATTCNYRWESSSDNGVTWATVGTSSTSYMAGPLALSDNGKQVRVTASDPGTNGDVPVSIQNYAVSTSATLSVTSPPGAETDTALQLNGTSYAQAPHNVALNINDSFTLEAWTYMTSFNSAGWNMVINKESSYELGISGGKWCYGLLGTSWLGVCSDISYELNVWHHVAITRTAGQNIVKFYLDGALAFTGSADGAGTGSIGTSSYPLTIGGRSDGVSATYAKWTGEIDEVRLFRTVRSASEIASDMHSYLPASTPGLQYYYDFNEGTGSAVYNRASGALAVSDLTLTSSPKWADIKTPDTSTLPAYTILKFERTYLTNTGGWKVPSGVSNVSALVVAGGGGGGWNSGGGGGGGGFLSINKTLVSGNVTIKVGAGGIGALSTDASQTPTVPPFAGQSSQFGETIVAGGNQGGVFAVTNAGGVSVTTASGSSGAGGAGGSSSGVVGSAGAAGLSSSIAGATTVFSSGGGGGGYNSAGGAAGTGAGAGGGSTTQYTGVNAPTNRGGGGGGSAAHVFSGNGGSGVIYVRWITASKPTYTAPTIAYLNAGMTETFTTNVAQDSATVNLTRTFRWESSTTGANGTFSLIKQGTGAVNASFSWVPSDTSTSGPNFVYRVIVTDSDTAGLFIVDTSTPVHAVINRALVVSGSNTIGKAINVAKNETFTITLGTSTYRPTLSPVIPGITMDTSTAGFAVIRIGDTVTVGTYYETLTVIDSVSAMVVTPLTIVVAAPPHLINAGEIVSDNLIYHLDAGNSQSLILGDTAAATAVDWKDLSGNGKHAKTSNTYDTGGFAKTCVAPTWSPNNAGSLAFNGSTTCYWSTYIGQQLDLNITVEAWVRLDGSSMNVGSMIVQQNYNPGTASNVNFLLGDSDATSGVVKFGLFDGGAYRQSAGVSLSQGVWTYLAGTYDGSNFKIYKDGTLINTSAVYTAGLGSTINNSGTIIGRRGSNTGSPFFNGSIATIRIYKVALTLAQIQQNYNSTKERFLTGSNSMLRPSQKYGQSQQDTFTITSGYGADTVSFTIGDRTGVDWDTATVNTVKLAIQESLTVGTYNDTVTVTDSLGQSSYLPITMTISKADTITVTLRNPKTVVYTGLPAALLPDINITGLVGSDTGTASRLYSAPASLPGATDTYTALVRSSTVPTQVETYTVSVETLTSLSVGSLSNYQGIIYETSTLKITQANQPALMVNYFGAVAGSTFTLKSYGGAGTGAYSETITSGSSALNCSISGHVLSNASPSNETKTCAIIVSRAASRNYKAESMTATIYFFAFTFNAEPQAGSGPGIGLSGINTVTLDSGSAPTISGLSTSTLSLSSGGNFTITGGGFGTSQITVKFWRNKIIYATSTDGTTLVIPVSSINAVSPTTGKVMVITANGIAVSINNLTITP